MATNAKEINELNAATSVASADLVAISQAGNTEATKATVEQVSAAVADALEDGAYAELTYATSQGKNAIATALTNKGVATSASETLIQMADKVNNLTIDVENSVENHYVKLSQSVPTSSAFSGGGTTAIFNEDGTVGALVTKNTLYIYANDSTYNGEEFSISYMQSHAVASCALNTQVTYSRIAISRTGSIIAVWDPSNGIPGGIQLYKYNDTANTVAYYHTIQTSIATNFPFTYGNTGMPILKDDGTLMLYSRYTTGLVFVWINNEVPDGSEDVSTNVTFSSVYYTHSGYITDNNFYIGTYRPEYSVGCRIIKGAYTIDTSTHQVTASNINAVATSFAADFFNIYMSDSVAIITAPYNAYGYWYFGNYAYGYNNICVVRLSDLALIENIIWGRMVSYNTNISYVGEYSIASVLISDVVDNGAIVTALIGNEIPITYTVASNTLSYIQNYPANYGVYSTSSLPNVSFAGGDEDTCRPRVLHRVSTDSGEKLAIYVSRSLHTNYTASTTYMGSIVFDLRKDQCITKTRKINGHNVLYTPALFRVNQVAQGYFDKEVIVSPAVPDSEN